MRRLVLLVGAVVFVDTTFFAAITPLLPAYASDLDLSKSAAGVLSAAYAAGTLLGTFPGAVFAARVGVRPTVLVGMGLMSVAGLVFGFADSIVLLDAARFLQGVGGAFSWIGGLAWLV
ncbi:MAG: MFS transporter, partial [Solirubrobacteraceae bacterium]